MRINRDEAPRAMRRVLVLDGVTGSGKSSVLRELQRDWPRHAELIPEDDRPRRSSSSDST
jgi:uridine kinase